MATPHVAAVAALMLSVDPSLTPAQIKSYLQSSARPHPPGTICTQTDNLGLCGAGLLDAYKALSAVKVALSPPVVTSGSIPSVVAPGDSVSATDARSNMANKPDCLFNWAEQNYAQYFSPAGAISQTYAPYSYRYYSGTGNYLAVSSLDNHLWVMGSSTGNKLFDVGPATDYLGKTTCR